MNAVTPCVAKGFYLLRLTCDLIQLSELNKVRVICEQLGNDEGYVIASQFKDGRWIYKISISEDPKSSETFDNWISARTSRDHLP